MYKLTIKDIKYSDKIVKPFEITDDIINSITLKSFKTLTKEQSITLNFVIAVTNFGRISYIVKENFDVEKYNMIRAEIVRDNEYLKKWSNHLQMKYRITPAITFASSVYNMMYHLLSPNGS